jgi:AcrR family transcriptional regulator
MFGQANDVQDKAPGDRRSARREATKAEIVDAAWALVREHGLAALSLRDLAARVGMRAPSLYQYFDSKHAIYDAMFQQGAEAMLEAATFDDGIDDPREVLRRRARRFFDMATSDPARTQLLFQRTIPGFEPSPEAYAPAVEMINKLREGLAALGITGADALDLWTVLQSGLVNQQLANDPGGDRYAPLVDVLVDMFLAHVAPVPMKKGK